MSISGDRGAAALRSLIRASHYAGPDDLPRLAQEAGRHLGADRTVIYRVDYDQVLLVPLVDGPNRAGDPVQIEGTLAGRAFAELVRSDSRAAAGWTLWLPLLDGTERLGVIEFTFGRAAQADDRLRDDCAEVATLIAELLITRSSYGDAIESARRRVPLTLAAELQWHLLPPLTFINPRVGISGVLVPTADVAGDSFDYAINGDVAHVAIVDAMGHGLEATLLSSVALGALRNARRSGLGMLETVSAMDRGVAAQFGPEKFVTAIVAELDAGTGVWRWVTCGHPPALLVRQHRVVKMLDEAVGPPLGLPLGDRETSEERLEPGDRLLLYSDGVVEARNDAGEFFGTERLVEFVSKEALAGRPVPETLRRLNLAILAHQAGALQDDATTVLVELRSRR